MTWLEIAERAEAASGADRELDHAVFALAAPKRWRGRSLFAPEYTASVDAMLSLIAETLPGWGYRILFDGRSMRLGTLFAPPEEPDAPLTDGRSWSVHHKARGRTDALALLAAYARARHALGEAGR